MKKLLALLLLCAAFSASAATVMPFAIFTGISPQLTLTPCSHGGTNVSPCGVYFDASATTSSLTALPFHELQYCFNAGDGSAPNWTNGTRAGQSSNTFCGGPQFAHVYECHSGTTCTFTVNLTVTHDGTNYTALAPQTITVTDADSYFSGTKTNCVSGVADYTGCPSGATHTNSSSFSSTVSDSTDRRTLYHGGETFTSTGYKTMGNTGPGTVGSYGTGRATIQGAGGSSNAGIFSTVNSFVTVNDWRFMDLILDYNGSTQQGAISISGNSTKQSLLFYNLSFNAWESGIGVDGNAATQPDGIFILKNTMTAINGNPYFIWAGHFAFMDNSTLNSGTNSGFPMNELRVEGITDSWIANNSFSGDTGTSGSTITIRSYNTNGRTPTAEKIVVADNVIATGPNFNSIDVQLSQSDVLLPTNIIVERNWITTTSTGSGLDLHPASYVTARNNLYDCSGGTPTSGGFRVRFGNSLNGSNLSFYNNSLYCSSSGSNFVAFLLENNPSIVNIINNAAYFPSATSPVFYSATGSPTSITRTNNSSDSQVKNTTPGWTLPPNTIAKWKASGGSYAVGGGTSVPVWSDCLLAAEPSPYDIGACAH